MAKTDAVNGMTIGGQATQAAEVLKATQGTDSALETVAKKVAALKDKILAVTVVNTEEEAAALGAEGRKAVETDTALEKDRTALTRPLNAVLDIINGKFGAIQKPCKAIAKHARDLIGDHDSRKRAAAEKARWQAQVGLDLEAAADLTGPVFSLVAQWEVRVKSGGSLDEWELRTLARMQERVKEIKAALRKHERAVDRAEEKGKEAPPPPAAPVPAMTAVAPQVSKHVGGTTKVSLRWKYELIDNGALLPREYLLPNTVAIQKAVDDGVREIPGCKIEQKSQVGL